MAWVELVTHSGVTSTFRTLPLTSKIMIIPKIPLPINILNIEQLEQTLNNIILPGEDKKVMLIEGFYPQKFGNWATHKVFRITYQCRGQKGHLIGKVMEEDLGNKEFTTLSNLSRSFNTPKPFCFMYDAEMKREFPNAGGILWMRYVQNIGHFQDCLTSYCLNKEERDYKLKDLAEFLLSVWTIGLKHNDLRAHHLLFTSEEWFLIDFEKSERLFDEQDAKDDLATLVGDATLYFDRFTTYYCIEISGNAKKRYELFLSEFLKWFKVKGLLNNRHLLKFLQFIQNKELKASLGILLD